jgi:two-component sensor histidine kinase
MVHDTARVEAIRRRVAVQLDLITSLESNIAKGKLDALEVARNQTNDIESLYLKDLDRHERSPEEEARWLFYAEQMLGAWGPYLKQTEEQFSRFDGKNIEIVGG